MKMTLHRLRLPLADEFTISRGSITEQESLVVELELDGVSGWGEVTANPYYGKTVESMEASLRKLESQLPLWNESSPEAVWTEACRLVPDDLFAISALDMALHDLASRREGVPLFRRWGLSWDSVPESSFTIGIDTTERMVEKLVAHPGWGRYKIKLGTDRDLEIVRELRRHTDATFRVDANCGWSAEQAVAQSAALADLNVEFIEQPLPREAPDAEHRHVYESSVLPVVADESCQTEADVERSRDRFHGVNVKLCKCGGLTPARRMLLRARELGMKTMVGCMIESSIGISGAAQLLPLLDYADLDGAVLLAEDPAEGVRVERGQVELVPGAAGTGARLGDPDR